MSSKNTIPNPANYTVPTRNVTTLGYGHRRPDGRLSERRRPSTRTLSNKALRDEAIRIPHGTGENLTDRERMILCYLPHMDRHKRASNVFNNRGEWFSKYKYMTTMDDAFLAMCDMPRIYVPRALGDRPTSRNVEQVRLEEEDVARRGAYAGYTRDQTGNEGVRNIVDFTAHAPALPPATQRRRRRGPHVPTPTLHLEVSMIPDLVDPDAFQYLNPGAQTLIITLPIVLDLRIMGYKEVCDIILQAFNINAEMPPPGVPEMYVGTLLARRTDPVAGNKEIWEVYEYNWRSAILPFITSHPMTQMSLAFGVVVAEEIADEEREDGFGAIDPQLLN